MITSIKITPRSKHLHLIIKVLLTIAALYFVFTKVQIIDIIGTIRKASPLYLIFAFLAFNVSKIISAFRLNLFYKSLGLKLSEGLNLMLYYVGMFYNLFLPGSIGGDGYKVYLLKQSKDTSTKQLVSATLLDRISGLVILTFLACIFILSSEFVDVSIFIEWLAWMGLIGIIPLYYFSLQYIFKSFSRVFFQTTLYSFWVQLGQVACALFILFSLSVENQYFGYLTLFMISSVVAVLPISIGGVGIREIVFLYGIRFLDIEESHAVAFAMLFFSTVALSALVGLLFLPSTKKIADELKD